jgi:hypothetical protein
MKRQTEDTDSTDGIGDPDDIVPAHHTGAAINSPTNSPEHSKTSPMLLAPMEAQAKNRISESPGQADDDWSAEEREWQKNLKETERRILGFPALKNKLYLLERIEAKGVARNRLVKVLAMLVSEEPADQVFRYVAKKRDELKKLSGALETVARKTDRVVSDPLSYWDTWFYLLLDPSSVPHHPSESKFPLSKQLERLAAAAKVEARKIDMVMRLSRRRRRRIGLVTLLGYVQKTTKTAFDAELVQLLTIAFRAVGVKRRFTIEQLRKIRKRHVMPELDKQDP